MSGEHETTIEVTGEIDARMMREICALIGSLVDENQSRVRLDLSRVDHVHFQSVKLLIERGRQLRSLGGDLRIAGLSRYTASIFHAFGAGFPPEALHVAGANPTG